MMTENEPASRPIMVIEAAVILAVVALFLAAPLHLLYVVRMAVLAFKRGSPYDFPIRYLIIHVLSLFALGAVYLVVEDMKSWTWEKATRFFCDVLGVAALLAVLTVVPHAAFFGLVLLAVVLSFHPPVLPFLFALGIHAAVASASWFAIPQVIRFREMHEVPLAPTPPVRKREIVPEPEEEFLPPPQPGLRAVQAATVRYKEKTTPVTPPSSIPIEMPWDIIQDRLQRETPMHEELEQWQRHRTFLAGQETPNS
jgi:hypothetical protein